MNWIDQVLALPTVGCLFEPAAVPWTEHLNALQPRINEAMKKGTAVVETPAPMSLNVGFDSGFRFKVTEQSLVVEFRYPFELQDQPGGMPEAKYKIEVQKYTDLLNRVIEEESNLLDLVLKSNTRSLVRIGIVSTCRIDGASPPPGLTRFIEHLQQPWGKPSLPKCAVHLLSVLEQSDGVRDQCHHNLVFAEETGNDIRLSFDWQRFFLAPIAMRSAKVRDELKKCSAEALKYFDKFGKGELGYESMDGKHSP